MPVAARASKLLRKGRARALAILNRNVELTFPAYLGRGTIWHCDGRVRADSDLTIDRWVEIVAYRGATISFGKRCYVGHSSTLAAHRAITIGDDVLIADFVTIRDHEHRFDQPRLPIRRQGVVTSEIAIGNNVWIGSKATITAGTRIGANSIVGANSVVTKDVPANTIVGGVPARTIGEVPSE